MNRFVIILVFLSFQFIMAQSLGVLNSLVGEVKVFSAQHKTWGAGRLNQELYQNDKVKTAVESRAEINLANNGIIRIDENSEILLSPQNRAKDQKVQLASGKIWANMKKIISQKRKFEIQTPTATASIRGTVFRVDEASDSSADVLVYNGKVDVGPSDSLKKQLETAKKSQNRQEVEGPTEIEGPTEVSLEAWVSIVAGQQISVQPNGSYKKFEFDQKEDAKNNWVKYNLEQDKLLQ